MSTFEISCARVVKLAEINAGQYLYFTYYRVCQEIIMIFIVTHLHIYYINCLLHSL